jgi:hypothetical protein
LTSAPIGERTIERNDSGASPSSLTGPIDSKTSRQFSPGLGAPARSQLDRAFNDLLRLYFVAFSRAPDVLLLVGLDSVVNGIPNVATGWDRDEVWHWGPGMPTLMHI